MDTPAPVAWGGKPAVDDQPLTSSVGRARIFRAAIQNYSIDVSLVAHRLRKTVWCSQLMLQQITGRYGQGASQ
jgi:hypothetical protein